MILIQKFFNNENSNQKLKHNISRGSESGKNCQNDIEEYIINRMIIYGLNLPGKRNESSRIIQTKSL